jgi:hypothetical protein
MTNEYIGSQDTNLFLSWPVCWAPAVRHAVARGQPADILLDEPQFVAHRILDSLAALASDVYQGAPDASSAFVDAICKLIGAAPWMVSDNGRRITQSITDSQNAHDSQGAHPGVSTPKSVQSSLDDALIDSGGVIALLAVAARLAGKDGARAILEVSSAAIAAEQWLPGLSNASDAGYRADIAVLGGAFIPDVQQRSDGARTSQIAPLSIGAPVWEKLSTLAQTNTAAANKIRCIKLFHELTDNAVPPPEPQGSVSWTTGIDHVQVTDPCGASPLLTIHGQGFGAATSEVGVVAAIWDEATSTIVYRTVPVVSWSDTQVVVKLGPNAVSGIVAFADIVFIKTYNLWADGENERVATAMRAAGCPGYGPPASPVIWPHWSETPAPAPAATYEAGIPHIVAEITLDPVGKAPALWDKNSVHLETGQTFWVLWRTANADNALLGGGGQGGGTALQILLDAGYPTSGVTGTSGSVKLVAPSQPAVVEFLVEASNTVCGDATFVPLRLVVTGPALQPVTITVLQSLPGGDVDVVPIAGSGFMSEALDPPTGQSIPLVAQKRTVARIDWWTAFPQVPIGEILTAEASIHVSGLAISWPGVTLRPGTSTANPPPTALDPPITLQSGRPFSSILEYEQWIAQNNNPATFNVVLPAELCVGQITLETTVRARNQDGRLWTETATRTVDFHLRRRIRIRYRRYSNGPNPAPTTQEAEAAIRDACSMLPIPDPEIIALAPNVVAQNGRLVEDMMVERGGTPTSSWRDEIWLVVGPALSGGVTNASKWPWTAATDATARTTAHEIGHLFRQKHLNLCGVTGADDPALFPNNANVVVTGWDMWNNEVVRGAVDIMTRTYCPEPTWMSPERWRRIFLQVGP